MGARRSKQGMPKATLPSLAYRPTHFVHNMATGLPICGQRGGYITDQAENTTCPECKGEL